jgi:hypothetical protein
MINSWLDYKKIFDIDLFELLDEVFKINSVQQEVIRLNQEQLYSGIDSQDKLIHTISGHPYALKTIWIKRKKGQKTDVVTLKDTGEFYESFRVRITENGYEILADFEKADENILDNFTNEFDFLGLINESLQELVDNQVMYQLTKLLRNKLGL